MTDTLISENLKQLTEHIRDWQSEDLSVDRPNRLVRNVALTAVESKNGYRYSEEALRTAVTLYDGKPVFLDHAVNGSRPYERSARDLAGSIVNPHFENGRIRGDISVLETEAGQTFLALAEAENPTVGMSHVVLAERNAEKSVVEKIHDVVSVDAVVFPATASTFQENNHTESVTRSPESLDETDIESLTAERDELRRQLDQQLLIQQETEREREIEQLIAESELPEHAVSAVFRKQLCDAPHVAARRALISERVGLLQHYRRLVPSSRERVFSDSSSLDDTAIIATIRHPRRSVLAGVH